MMRRNMERVKSGVKKSLAARLPVSKKSNRGIYKVGKAGPHLDSLTGDITHSPTRFEG
jgi:hypothetical protein